MLLSRFLFEQSSEGCLHFISHKSSARNEVGFCRQIAQVQHTSSIFRELIVVKQITDSNILKGDGIQVQRV